MTDAGPSVAAARAELARIFPSLPDDVGTSGESVFTAVGPTHDSLMRDFASYFERNFDAFSDRQLRRFADLLAARMASPGPLAQAIEKCFIDAIVRTEAGRRFGPVLAKARE